MKFFLALLFILTIVRCSGPAPEDKMVESGLDAKNAVAKLQVSISKLQEASKAVSAVKEQKPGQIGNLSTIEKILSVSQSKIKDAQGLMKGSNFTPPQPPTFNVYEYQRQQAQLMLNTLSANANEQRSSANTYLSSATSKETYAAQSEQSAQDFSTNANAQTALANQAKDAANAQKTLTNTHFQAALAAETTANNTQPPTQAVVDALIAANNQIKASALSLAEKNQLLGTQIPLLSGIKSQVDGAKGEVVTSISDVNGALQSVQNALGQVDALEQSLEGSNTAFQQNINSLITVLVEIQANVSGWQQSIQGIQVATSTITEQLGKLLTAIGLLNDLLQMPALASVYGTLTEIRNLVQVAHDNIASANQDILNELAVQQSILASLQYNLDKVQVLAAAFQQIHDDFASLSTLITGIKSDLLSAQSKLQVVVTRLNSVVTTLTNISSGLSSVIATLTALKNGIDADLTNINIATARIDSLIAQLQSQIVQKFIAIAKSDYSYTHAAVENPVFRKITNTSEGKKAKTVLCMQKQYKPGDTSLAYESFDFSKFSLVIKHNGQVVNDISNSLLPELSNTCREFTANYDVYRGKSLDFQFTHSLGYTWTQKISVLDEINPIDYSSIPVVSPPAAPTSPVSEDRDGFCTQEKIAMAPFAGGNGSISNPYLICSSVQFSRIAQEEYHIGKSFKLMRSVNFSGTAPFPTSFYSTQTASADHITNLIYNNPSSLSLYSYFKNLNFDGNNYELSNLSVIGTTTVGLFPFVYNGSVKRLGIRNSVFSINNPSLYDNNGYGGAVIGYALGNVVVEDSYVISSSVTATYLPNVSLSNFMGGVIGGTQPIYMPGEDGNIISSAKIAFPQIRRVTARLINVSSNSDRTLSVAGCIGGANGPISIIGVRFQGALEGSYVNGLFGGGSASIEADNLYYFPVLPKFNTEGTVAFNYKIQDTQPVLAQLPAIQDVSISANFNPSSSPTQSFNNLSGVARTGENLAFIRVYQVGDARGSYVQFNGGFTYAPTLAAGMWIDTHFIGDQVSLHSANGFSMSFLGTNSLVQNTAVITRVDSPNTLHVSGLFGNSWNSSGAGALNIQSTTSQIFSPPPTIIENSATGRGVTNVPCSVLNNSNQTPVKFSNVVWSANSWILGGAADEFGATFCEPPGTTRVGQ